MTNNIKLSQLRALLGVAQHGNFSEAALDLNLSQSAISHAIACLEEELGVSLFQRGRYGAVITPVGERVIREAQQVMQSLERLVYEATIERGLQGGRLRVGTFRSVAAHVLPSVIVQFQRLFPQIDIVLTEREDYPDVEHDLRSGKVDVGFTHLPCQEDLEAWEVLRDEYVVLLPPKLRPTVSPLTWEELATYPLIVASGDQCGGTVREHLARCGQQMRIAYEVKEDSTMVGMVSQGLGAAILPRLAAEPLPSQIRVCSLPICLERMIGVAVLGSALHSPAVYAFLDAVRGTGRFSSIPQDSMSVA